MKNLKATQLKPLAGYVLVEPAQPEEKTASGIILPGNKEEKPQYGTVLACGKSDCGSCGDCSGCGEGCGDCGEGCGDCGDKAKKAKSGSCDLVIYKKWGGNDVMIDDVEYQFLKFEDILAVVSKK